MKKRVNWKVLIFSIIIVFATVFLGSLFTSKNTNSSWYIENKPAITPPNFIFPIVWNILFFLIAISLYLSWINAGKKGKQKIATVFGINLILNASWSYLFFTLQKPKTAFFELIALWISITGMIYITKKYNEKSAWLLVPYLLWVLFAGYLNYLWAFA